MLIGLLLASSEGKVLKNFSLLYNFMCVSFTVYAVQTHFTVCVLWGLAQISGGDAAVISL